LWPSTLPKFFWRVGRCSSTSGSSDGRSIASKRELRGCLAGSTHGSFLKGNHSLEGHAEALAQRAKGSEGRAASTRKQVAQRSLVNVSLPSQVPTRPAPQDSRTIDHGRVDGPFKDPLLIQTKRSRLARTRGSLCGRGALEGTVLRVPRLPSSRLLGFWRSSVRGPGPPASNHSAARSRRPPCRARRAETAASARPQQVEAFALRDTRMNARTRCGLLVA